MTKEGIIQLLKDKIEHETERYMEEQKEGGVNSHMTSSARGRVEALTELLEEISP